MRWFLPWCRVSGNNLYFTRGRKRVLSPEARAWRDDVIVRIRSVGFGTRFDDEHPLRLSIVAYQPDRRRRDADGLIKPTQDAIALACGFDDARIRKVESELVPKDEWPSGMSAPCLLVELTYWAKGTAA